jgi:phage baseplate assembly protein V
VLSPSADPAQAVILPSLYQDSLPAPASSPDVHRVEYADGAVVQYDRAAHHLDVLLPGEATLRVVAVGGITIDAHGGDVVVHGDVIADGISLKDHVHSGVTRGGAYTDPPVGGGA